MTTTLKTSHSIRLLTMLFAGAAVALVAPGCDTVDWDDPEDVARVLEEGSFAQKSRAAEQLREIPRDRRDDLAGPAASAYEEEESLRSDLMRQLIEWRHPDAQDAYIIEMREDHAGYGDAAARVVGQLGVEDAAPSMIEAYEETTDHARRIGILRGLAYIPDREGLDKALDVLDLDVDNYPIGLHRAACEFIGGLAMVDPDAIDEQVRDRLAYARMLMSEDGRTVDEKCGLAIQQVGHDMIPHLIELFNEEHEGVQRLLLTYDNPSGGEYFPQNEAKVTAAEHLSALRAPEAAELYSDELSSPIEEPDLRGESLHHWRANEAQTINEMVRGLGDIGDPAARSTLEDIAQGVPFSDEWEAIIDGTVAFQMLQDSARALARLGDRDARSTLLEMTEAEIIPEMQARFQYMEEQDSSVPLVEQLRPQWVAAKSFAYLAEGDDRDELESLIEAVDDEELEEKLESFLVAFDVMDECEDVGVQAERASCFGQFLDDDSEIAREKAALELSRLSPEAAGPVIVEHIDTDDLELRETLTFAGYRVPVPELADRIQEVVEAESGETGSEYQIDHYRLRMLHAWLQHQDEDDVAAH